MAPKRKNADLPLKSIWDETLLSGVLTNPQHRAKLWNHLILSTRNSLSPSLGYYDSECMKQMEKDDHQQTVLINEITTERCDSAITSSTTHTTNRQQCSKTGYKLKSRLSLDDIPYHAWNIPKKQAQRIVQEFSLFTTRISERSESARGDTTKLLVELQDGHQVETVIMRHVGHATACISSQIGCQMGCRFCATGTMGIIGDLTSGEIIEQLVHANSITRIRNVVFMGMGEPLNNYDNMKKAVEFMVDNRRFAMSPKHVTISTVGVLKSMYRLSDELPFVNLALSLHAPNQDVRIKIVPAARAHPIEKLLDAVDYHIEQNRKLFEQGFHGIDCPATTNVASTLTAVDKRTNLAHNSSKRNSKVTGCMIEYILIRDVNDKDEHAHELAKLLEPRRDHVLLNLIPYNPTEVAEDYEPPTNEQVASFHRICISEPYHIHCRVRQEKGQDIAGACGQLALVSASKKQKEQESPAFDVEDAHLKNGSSHANGDDERKCVDKTTTELQSIQYEGRQLAKKQNICSTLVKANVVLAVAIGTFSVINQMFT